jgi:transposase
MKKEVIIGVDFSKLTMDVTYIQVEHPDVKHYQQFKNTEEGCLSIIKWAKRFNKNTCNWLVCGEFTGIYSMTAAMVFNQQDVDLWLENPSQIKLSSGVSREKNDKVDSCQIAIYAKRFLDRAKLFKPGTDTLLKLRELVRFKDRLTKVRKQLLVPAKELKRVRKDWDESVFIDDSSKELAHNIELKIKVIEEQMMSLLKTDPDLKKKYELITSVVGVGMQTAIFLLIHTWGFTAFDTPRQLACYCGIVPFSKQSGTSLKGKRMVSHIANKKLKTLLHMCALNAIRYDPTLKAYYERKLNEGKHKMNILNNVRNKVLHRICAVIRTGDKYDLSYHTEHQLIAA